MSNIVEIVNRSQAINAEIKTIRQRPDLTLADFQQLASLRVDLLHLCPPQRYVWLAGRPVIDLFCELACPVCKTSA